MVGLAKFANFVAFGLGTVPDFDNVARSSFLRKRPSAQPVRFYSASTQNDWP